MRKPTEQEEKELLELMTMAKAARDAFSEALEATAAQCQVNKPALRKYIAALFSDKVSDASEEADDLQALLSQ